MKTLLTILLIIAACNAHASSDTLTVHLFASREQADSAVQIINTGEGIPHDAHATTTSYVTPIYYNGQWYLEADEITTRYLGAPAKLYRNIPKPTIN